MSEYNIKNGDTWIFYGIDEKGIDYDIYYLLEITHTTKFGIDYFYTDSMCMGRNWTGSSAMIVKKSKKFETPYFNFNNKLFKLKLFLKDGILLDRINEKIEMEVWQSLDYRGKTIVNKFYKDCSSCNDTKNHKGEICILCPILGKKKKKLI